MSSSRSDRLLLCARYRRGVCDCVLSQFYWFCRGSCIGVQSCYVRYNKNQKCCHCQATMNVPLASVASLPREADDGAAAVAAC
jgi:hypothetical protein